MSAATSAACAAACAAMAASSANLAVQRQRNGDSPSYGPINWSDSYQSTHRNSYGHDINRGGIWGAVVGIGLLAAFVIVAVLVTR